MANIEDMTPLDCLASRVWSGTRWYYPNIELMVQELKELRTALAAMKAERDALRGVVTTFEREYENGFPAHATGSIGGTGHPIGSCADCGACRLHAVYEIARLNARDTVEGER